MQAQKRRSWGRGNNFYPLESYHSKSQSWKADEYTESEKKRIAEWKRKLEAVNSSNTSDKSEPSTTSNKELIDMWNKYKTSKLSSSAHHKECGVCGIGVDDDWHCKNEKCQSLSSDSVTLKREHSLKVEERKTGSPRRCHSPPRNSCACTSCVSRPHHSGCPCSSCGVHMHNKHDRASLQSGRDYHTSSSYRHHSPERKPRQWRHSWGRSQQESPWKKQ